MDYEELMNQAMTYIQSQMKTYKDLAKGAESAGKVEMAKMCENKYIAIRDIKIGIDNLALQMKNGE